MEYFVAGATAQYGGRLMNVNKNTAALYFQRLGEIIAHQMEQECLEVFEGEIEGDESYFGGTQKGKRVPGAVGKVPVFRLLKRGGKGYTQIIPDAKSATLMPIIKQKIVPDSVVYSDCWRAYKALDT
jgi:transposase